MDKETVPIYQKNYIYLRHESSFLFEYAQCLNRLGRHKESNQALTEMKNISCDPMVHNVMGRNFQSMKQYREAEMCFLKSTRMVPNRLYPHYLLMKLYKEQGDTLKMKKTIVILLQKKPKVDSPAVRDMKEEAKKLQRLIASSPPPKKEMGNSKIRKSRDR